MIKKFLKIILGIFLVVGLSGFFILNTQNGLRFSLMVVAKIIPGKLTVNNLSGNLLDAVNLKDLSYENNSFRLIVKQTDLKLRLVNLLQARFSLPLLHADGIIINLKDSSASKKSFALSDIVTSFTNALKLVFKFEDVQLKNISLQHAGLNKPVFIDKLFVRVDYVRGDINQLDVELKSKYANFSMFGSIKSLWDLSWQFDFKDISHFYSNATGAASGFGKIIGKRKTPISDVTITSNNFKYPNIEFSQLEIATHIDSYCPEKSKFKLNLLSPKINKISLNKLAIVGDVSKSRRSLKLNIRIDSSTIFSQLGSSTYSLKIDHIDLSGEFNKGNAQVLSKIFIAESDPVNIELNLSGIKKVSDLINKANQPIKGIVTWQTRNLVFLEKFFPKIKNIKGFLTADFYISGAISQPKFSGKVNADIKSLQFPSLNTTWQNIVISTHLVNEGLIKYQGEVYSGLGKLNLTGKTVFSEDNNQLISQVEIAGADFLLANNSQYYLIVSPQLKFGAVGNALQILGKISIPKAKIAPSDLQRSDSLPPELVYAHEGKEQKEEGLNLKANLKLELGNSVDIDIMGLKGRVKGQVDIIDEPQQVVTATGALNINDGVYSIYGRELKITKGALNFWGGPVKNPNIDVEAVHVFKKSAIPDYFVSDDKSLTAGVRVSGMISNPKVDLFSIPAGLDKADILSYLVVGQSSQGLSDNKGQLLMQAASMLNFGDAGEVSGFMGNLKDNLGFDEFGFEKENFSASQSSSISSLDAENNGNNSQNSLSSNTVFVLGKFLTPKLYVSYSQALLDSVSIFRIRYYMSKYWSIQSESGGAGDSAVDIIYSYER